jgi:hypothetical protein
MYSAYSTRMAKVCVFRAHIVSYYDSRKRAYVYPLCAQFMFGYSRSHLCRANAVARNRGTLNKTCL